MVYTVTAGRVLPAVALAVLVFESAMTLDGKGLPGTACRAPTFRATQKICRAACRARQRPLKVSVFTKRRT